jgi:type II secretion system protein H
MTTQNHKGFTLIELMFVAVVLTVLAALAASRMRRSFDALSGELAAREMLSLMYLARARAIGEGSDYGVRITPGENSYYLVRRADSGGAAFDRIPGRWGVPHRLPRDIDYKGGEQVVTFYPDGTASPAQLRLAARDQVLTLIVDPIQGEGRLHEGS